MKKRRKEKKRRCLYSRLSLIKIDIVLSASLSALYWSVGRVPGALIEMIASPG